MTFRSDRTSPRPAWPLAAAAALALASVAATPARADNTTSSPAALNAKNAVTADSEEGGLDLPVSLSLIVEESIGTGTFVQASDEQRQTLVATAFVPTLVYPFATDMTVSATVSGTWYHRLDFGTTLPDGEFLWSDLALRVGHGNIWKDEDLGLTLSGSFTALMPTSLASRFQTRWLSFRPALGLAWSKGPVTVSGLVNYTKYLTRSNVPELDCSRFADPSQCRQGRSAGPGPGGGFVSERSGGDVFLPSSGVSSFAMTYGMSVGWEIIDALSLSSSVTVIQTWGMNRLDTDAFSSPNARDTRSQTDRLIATVGLSYQVLKQLGVGVSFTQDTVRPFGANGERLVLFERWLQRAPDNLSTLAISLTGSL